MRNAFQLRDVIESAFTGMVLTRQLARGARTRMKIVGTKDIENGLLSPKGSLQEMVLPESLQTERFRLKTGDVVMTARGTIKISAVNDDQSGCFAGPNLIVIRPGTQLHSALLLAFLRHPKTQDEIKRRSVGTTVQA